MEITIKDIIDLINALAWPIVTLIIVLILRRELKSLTQVIIERATKISGGGMTVELAATQVKNQTLEDSTNPEEKAKALINLDIAKAVAPKFDYWMKRYNHPPGKTHYELLLDWLVAGRGAKYLAKDYGIFKALAEVLSKMGYDTLPSPSEGQFMMQLSESDKKEEYRKSKKNS